MAKQKITLKDIAEAAGVDASTVSLCLNNSPKISETTKLKVKEMAEKMDYTPNLIAKALKSGKSNTVGICLYSLSSDYFNKMLTSMQAAFYNNEYFPLITGLKTSDPKWILQNLLQRNIDGLCLANPSRYFDLYLDFANAGKPLSIYIEKNSIVRMSGMKANYAVCDLSEGTRKIFDYLYDLNHRRIGFVGMIPNRFYDYCSLLNQHNIELDERLVINDWGSLEELEKSLLSMMKTPSPPSAIFVNADSWAVDVMEILLNRGYRIPEDVSLISINDLPSSRILRVPLTTLRIPILEIGKAMAEMLLDQINGTSTELQVRNFDTELIVRKSVIGI
jgi:LacI family transcriptional regulator